MSVPPNSLCQSCRNIVACGKPCHQSRGQHTPHALRKHVAPCGCRCTATGSCSEGALGHGIPFWACWWLPHNRAVRTCASASPMTSPRVRAAPRARPRAVRRHRARSCVRHLNFRVNERARTRKFQKIHRTSYIQIVLIHAIVRGPVGSRACEVLHERTVSSLLKVDSTHKVDG